MLSGVLLPLDSEVEVSADDVIIVVDVGENTEKPTLAGMLC